MLLGKLIIEGKAKEIEGKKSEIDNSEKISQFIREKGDIPINHLNKYYLNDNLSFLCGSGTSVVLGGKTINKGEDPFEGIINELEGESSKSHLTQVLNYLKEDILLEKKFDKINQEYLYHLNNLKKDKEAGEIRDYLLKILKRFVDLYIPFPESYLKDKLETHKLFINKIISRKSKLNRPKIFTPNYDLAFENACELVGVSYDNGFRGVHMRTFDPDTFKDEMYVREERKDIAQKISNYLNIYKLHGSISWQHSDSLNDLYNLVEIQISEDDKKDDFNYESLMIYPLQTKKSYSLDLPYSEIFRQFSKTLSDGQNTLVIIGYSFLDEHINDIILTGLYNPGFSLLIHTYSLIDDKSPDFLKLLKERSFNDFRINILEGELFGDFKNYVNHLIPLSPVHSKNDMIIETLKQLIKA